MSVKFIESKHIKKAIITFSFPITACNIAEIIDNKNRKHLEHALGVHSFFNLLSFKINGSPSDDFKSKFVDIKYQLQNNNCIITIITQNTFSAVRKVITIISKNLDVSKIKPVYKRYISHYEQKFNENIYDKVVADIAKGLKSLQCLVIGKVSLDTTKVRLLNTILKKGKVPTLRGEHKIDQSERVEIPENVIEFKKGVEGVMTKKYLQFNRIDTVIGSGWIYPIGVTKANIKNLNKKDKIQRFIQQKLLKLSAKADILLIICAIEGMLTVSELTKLPKNPTMANLSSFINL